ncbi:MAG: hypothetical protein U5K69_05900 [Balneolaceae bacterium]|nr:hypothetical protein [Balneolaceae bacterium]
MPSVKAANVLLKEGASVSKTTAALNISGAEMPAGSYNRNRQQFQRPSMSLTGNADFPSMALSDEPDDPAPGEEYPCPKWVFINPGIAKSMDEGWTRWLLKKEYVFDVDTLHDADIAEGDLSQYDSIILPSQSPSEILHGHSVQEMPEQFTGGLGLEGTLALGNITEAGGVLITFDESSDFVIEQFGLPLE